MSTVYFIRTADGEGLDSIIRKTRTLIARSKLLDKVDRDDFAAIKVHFGEKGNIGHVDARCVTAIARMLKERSDKVFLIETNTLYKGSRSNSVEHLRLAAEHGFDMSKTGVPIVIVDGLTGRNYRAVNIKGVRLKSVKVAADIQGCDFLLCVSHMKGHMQTGFGAALKNIGMGCASRAGKLEQHESVLPSSVAERCTACGECAENCPAGAISLDGGRALINSAACIGCGECVIVCRTGALEIKWSESIRVMQEKMAEYALGVRETIGKKGMAYINYVMHITKDCDCMAKDEPPIAKDVGILASDDPVAVDSASFDLTNRMNGRDVFKGAYPGIDPTIQLAHGERIGLGTRRYELAEIHE